MQYLIYQIKNKINNKIYIGAHATKDINDDYMGSGHALSRAKKKYGIENFTKEILYIFNDEKSMYAKEKEIVTEEFCNRKDNYNVRVGGIGGWNHVNSNPEKYRAIKSMHSKRIANRPENPFKDPEFQKKYDWTRAPDRMRMLGKKAQSPEARAKRKATLEKLNFQQGENNTQFGRYWVSNPMTKEIKRLNKGDAIPEGWVRGKTGHIPKKCWVNNGQVEHYILIEKRQEYLDKGYISGRFGSSMPQNRIVV